jgi:universal stress protein A
MISYQHILLAIDFTKGMDGLIAKACLIARLNVAKLSVVHVLDNIPMPDTPYGAVIALHDASENALLEQEKALFKQICHTITYPIEHQWLLWGTPKNEIIALATQEKIDLIMVGSQNRHGLALLFSSITNDILHHAPCDVLAVKIDE